MMMMNAPKNPHYLADPSAKERKDGKTVIIRPKALNIVWGGDSRYWNVRPDDIEKPAELRQVCWFEVTTCVEKTNPGKTYEVGFEISFSPDAFGWGANYPIYFMTKRSPNGDATWKKIVLDVNNNNIVPITRIVEPTTPTPSDHIIYFGLYEVWSGKWKGGLRIHNAFSRELH